ncbi:F-box protein PP2-B11 [Hevea brasiliensis]|uniref:F-box protein PP2-B11 n=1 Tax=Hevea brasiliensis TaxID=3981 RepID=UPI0025D20651|nr:F-box protein PP2-B11 [Hevea brasiliensis]
MMAERFSEMAELIDVYWLEITGKISIQMLSPVTLYVACFVFKSATRAHLFKCQPAEVTVGLAGSEIDIGSVLFDADRGQRRQYRFVRRLTS